MQRGTVLTADMTRTTCAKRKQKRTAEIINADYMGRTRTMGKCRNCRESMSEENKKGGEFFCSVDCAVEFANNTAENESPDEEEEE